MFEVGPNIFHGVQCLERLNSLYSNCGHWVIDIIGFKQG
jgi:hypothetical protein